MNTKSLASLDCRKLTATLSLLALLGWLFLLPVPRDPDATFGVPETMGTVCLFALWALATLSWGALVGRYLNLRTFFVTAAAMGTVCFSTLAQVMLVVTIAPGTQKWLVVSLALLGIALYCLSKPTPDSARSQSSAELLAWIPAALTVFSVIIRACLPHFHSDPLVYGALAPRMWSQTGRIQYFPSIPYSFMASNWDYLGIFGNALLGGDGDRGTIELHLFIQLTHAFFGFGVTVCAAALILEHLGFSKIGARLGACGIGSCLATTWTAFLAKSDWGVSAWVLGAILIYIEKPKLSRGRFLLIGYCLGLALAAKLTFILAIAPLVFILHWHAIQLRQFKWSAFLPVGIFFALLPWLLRNYHYTQNPLFPLADGIFHSPDHLVSEIFKNAFSAPFRPGEAGPFFILTRRLAILLGREPLAVMGLLALAWLSLKGRFRNTSSVIYFAPLSMALLLLTIGSPATQDDGVLMIRYLTPGLALLSALTFAFLFDTLPKSSFRTFASLVWIPLCFASADSKLTQIPAIINQMSSTTMALRLLMIGGEAKAWLRINAQPGDSVLTTGDSQNYYISHLNVASVTDRSDVWNASKTTHNPKDWILALAPFKIKYILDSTNFEGRYWTIAGKMLDNLVKTFPDSVVFRGRESYVVDYAKLKEGLLKTL